MHYYSLFMCEQMNDRRGHRKLRLTSRKHFQPKQKLPKSLRISISMQHVSVLKVSLPIELVNFRVSIPLKSFLDVPLPSVCVLQRRFQSLEKIPQGKFALMKFLSSTVIRVEQ